MKKTTTNPEISPKSTKDQILAVYNKVLEQLNEKQTETPLDSKKLAKQQKMFG